MTRLVRLELRKLATTRTALAVGGAAMVLVLLTTLLQLVVATAPDGGVSIGNQAAAYAEEAALVGLLDVSVLLALFALVLGVTAVTGELRHATVVGTFLATPRRERVLAAKVAAYLLVGAALGLVVVTALLATVGAWLLVSGEQVPLGSAVLLMLVKVALAAGLAAALGVGVGAAVPNQLTAVLIAVGWVLLVEQLLSGVVPESRPWLPFLGAIGGITADPAVGLLPAAGAAALAVAYGTAAAAAGAVVLRRADIG